MNKRSWKVSNSSAQATTTYWYCFIESNAPTDLDRDQYFPLKSFIIENKSSSGITIILDPVGTNSNKSYYIPDGKSLSLENKDNVTFHQVIVYVNGLNEIQIGQLNLTVRNY